MEKVLLGKMLVKKGQLSNGEWAVTITGVFIPQNFTIDEVDDADEMWVDEIEIKGRGYRHTNPKEVVSPEEFLEGKCQKAKDWKTTQKY